MAYRIRLLNKSAQYLCAYVTLYFQLKLKREPEHFKEIIYTMLKYGIMACRMQIYIFFGSIDLALNTTQSNVFRKLIIFDFVAVFLSHLWLMNSDAVKRNFFECLYSKLMIFYIQGYQFEWRKSVCSSACWFVNSLLLDTRWKPWIKELKYI